VICYYIQFEALDEQLAEVERLRAQKERRYELSQRAQAEQNKQRQDMLRSMHNAMAMKKKKSLR